MRDPLALARALIQRPSVTPEDAGALDVLAEALERLGFVCHHIRSATGGPEIRNLYARLGQGGPNFCFAGHTDVVPPGKGWTVEPFEAQMIDGRLFGRGAADMKGAIACFVAAVARRLEDGKPNGSISLLITGDEEGPAVDGTVKVLDWLAARGETLDACIVGEPTNPHRLGEMMKIGRRGSLNCRLTVFGTQGHSAYPHLADNPIPRLLDILNRLTAQPLDQGNAHFQPSTLALTTVDVGNPATNVIPAEAKAGFNIRFNDMHSGASLTRWIEKTVAEAGGEVEVKVEVSGESFLTPPGPLSEQLAEAITQVTGLTPDLSTTGGTSDARFIKNHCPVVEFGLVGQSMHKSDEHVMVADMEALTEIYRRVLIRIAG
ncbi:succinyl-diaminopimelate desuccinylase [Paramagnetospirillum marisnigri]|uniref:succinyl-diaminopimelate desuccinylase n=1 Tax=Paramagnetospirillum marisnigri TaxID=1285242 RepID=UPI0009ED2850|nr:succinyl-diaminopimelate desuccinylase [Paramagnetospirillum marisnigri]